MEFLLGDSYHVVFEVFKILHESFDFEAQVLGCFNPCDFLNLVHDTDEIYREML